MAIVDKVLEQLDANKNDALKRLFELLRIKSISADAAYADECGKSAEWLRRQLEEIGFAAEVRPTQGGEGKPIVIGKAKAAHADVPHVLFYGHYDVQPVDPLEEWSHDPFDPQIVETPTGKRIVCRGAADDKGQLMTFIEACRAFHETGGLPCDVTVVLEGEEESGSKSLPPFIAENQKELKADLALICDTNMWDRKTPAITIMLRGLVLQELILKGADHDLHSGMYGGAAINPIRVLGKIIGDLYNEDGSVALPNFYDGVSQMPDEIAEQWRKLKFSGAEFLKKVGLDAPAGEAKYSTLEQIWSRPTCDINGVSGGYMGEGSKTIVPAQVSAKFSFRLVGKQSPAQIVESFQDFVKERLPSDVSAQFISHGESPAIQLPFGSEVLSRARRALSVEWGVEPALIASGGSIPIVEIFKRQLKMDTLMIGFGLDDDRIHAPNEKYELTSFHKGARSWARVLMLMSA